MRKSIRIVFTALVCATLAVLPASLASANDVAVPQPVSTPIADHLVIDGAELSVAVMSDFPSSGDVVITDGTRAETGVITKRGHVTTDRAAGKLQSQAALAACGWTNWTAPFTWPVKWWLTRGCSLIGTTASATAGYTIDVDINSLGGACHQVYGYHLTPVSSGGYQYTGFWTGTGCINPGGDSGWTVPWGNVAAVKQLYAKTTGGAAGSAGMFK